MANLTLNPQSSPALFREAANTMPPKREHFLDYFPYATEKYPGFIKQEHFQTTMTRVIAECISVAGTLSARYRELPQHPKLIEVPDRFITESKLSIDQSGMDTKAKERAIEQYYHDIKTILMESALAEEWRMPNEMRMSEEMFAQSKAYRNAAIKSVSVEVVSNRAGKALGKPLSKFSGQTVNKFIKPNTTLNKIVGKGLGKEFEAGGKVLNIEFHGMGKLIDKSVEGYAEVIDHAVTSEKVKQYEGFEPEYFEDNAIGVVAEIASDLIPVFSWCKTGVKAAANAALSYETGEIANRMKAIEDQSNAAERNFNQKLKQTIHDDVSALSPEEIKNLIDIIGLTESTK